jgi:acetyltransferase
MLSGSELFIGATSEGNFGHLVMCGLGGILIEVMKDFSTGLVPLSKEEARRMVHNLRGYPVFQGIRGKEGINEEKFVDTMLKVSALLESAPEIVEMDLNPLLGNFNSVTVVDARIKIAKQSHLN